MCCCACLPRFCVASHVLCSVMYIGVGAVQLVAGIFFLISLPVFKVGSNVWTGVWNVVVGVGGAVFSSVGDLSPSKHRILLYLTITVLVLNLINLVVLELGEWRILMPDKVKATLQNHNLQTLVLYARMTTSISSALAVIIAFVDAQFMFCWLEHTLRPQHSALDHKETVSDIEYIIPRAKSGSMGKSNLYNQYQTAAQSWVFDSDTMGSTHSAHAPSHARANSEHHPSPYGKLQHYTNSSKTVVLRRKSNPNSHKLITHGIGDDDPRDSTKEQTMNGVISMSDDVTANSRLQPVVLVEGISNDERHLQFMTSFSRTPSPVQPRSESSSPCSNPAPIYECLERLTEPSVYRSRLNTALEATGAEPQERVSPSVSPRPHSVVVASDQQQYASLMVELERTIVAKFPAHDDSRRQSQSQVTSQVTQQSQLTQHKHSASDADFSRQLEAALQLIQDLESPNTVETPSDAPQLGFHQASEMASTSANNSTTHIDRTQHLLDTKSIEDRSSDDDNTWSSSSHEALQQPSVYGKVQGPLSRGAGQKTELKRKHTTVIRIRDGTERSNDNRVPRIDEKGVQDEENYKDSLESRLSSFQPEDMGHSASFTINTQAKNENRMSKIDENRVKDYKNPYFRTDSLEYKSPSSFQQDLGRLASFTNNAQAKNVNRVSRIDENPVKEDKNPSSSTDVQGYRSTSSFQQDLGRSVSFTNNSQAKNENRVSRIDENPVEEDKNPSSSKNPSFSTDSLRYKSTSSFQQDLGRSASSTNNSQVKNENRVSKIDENRVKEYRNPSFSTDSLGYKSTSSFQPNLGRSASFNNNLEAANENRARIGEKGVKNGDSLEGRLSSLQPEELGHSAYISNHCNDSGVLLDYSNSEESVNSGDVVVVVKTNGVIANGGNKECTVIREETEEDGVEGNGGLKNGGVQNGGIQNGAFQNGAVVSSLSSSASRSNSLKRSLSSVAKWKMFPKKRTARFVLTPELENTILKSESLLHLTDVELVARYDRNKSIQRKIEEKAWQKIIGASSTDSTC